MNQTTKVTVALIVAAGLSTMVYAIPEQRAMAHLRLSSDPSDLTDADVIPFGPNSPDPASKSDPPAVGPNSDPPSPGAGPPFGPNCVGCISTQNLANGAVTNPKLATGSVLSANIGAGAVATPNIADQAITTPKIAPGAISITTQTVENATGIIPPGGFGRNIATCPHGTILTGGGYGGALPLDIFQSSPSGPRDAPPTGWLVVVDNPSASGTSVDVAVFAVCATIHP